MTKIAEVLVMMNKTKYITILIAVSVFTQCGIFAQEDIITVKEKKISVYAITDSTLSNLLDSVINYEELFRKKKAENKVIFLISSRTFDNDSIIVISLSSNTKEFDRFPEGILYYKDYDFYMYDGFLKLARRNHKIKKIRKEEFKVIISDTYIISYFDTVDWYWKMENGKFVLVQKNEYRY